MNSGKIQHNKFAQLVAGLVTVYVAYRMWNAGIFDAYFYPDETERYENVGIIWMVLSYVVAGLQVIGYLALAASANIAVFGWDLFKFLRGTNFKQWSFNLPKFDVDLTAEAKQSNNAEQHKVSDNDGYEEDELDPAAVVYAIGEIQKYLTMLERERNLERYHEANTTETRDSDIHITVDGSGVHQTNNGVEITSSLDWNHPVSGVEQSAAEKPKQS